MVNSLPNDKILDWSNLKGLADDKIKVNQNLEFDQEKEENIVGKGENASIFSFSHNVFRRLFFRVIEGRDCMVKD